MWHDHRKLEKNCPAKIRHFEKKTQLNRYGLDSDRRWIAHEHSCSISGMFGIRIPRFLHPKTPTLFQIDPECYGSLVLKAKLTVPQNLEAHTNSSFLCWPSNYHPSILVLIRLMVYSLEQDILGGFLPSSPHPLPAQQIISADRVRKMSRIFRMSQRKSRRVLLGRMR